MRPLAVGGALRLRLEVGSKKRRIVVLLQIEDQTSDITPQIAERLPQTSNATAESPDRASPQAKEIFTPLNFEKQCSVFNQGQ